MHKAVSMLCAVSTIMLPVATVRAQSTGDVDLVRHGLEQDLRALYRYIKSIGPAGEPAPDYLPPGRKPDGPAIQFPG